MSNYIGEYKIGGELQFAQRRTHWMTSNLKSEVDLKIRNDLGSMKKTKKKKTISPKDMLLTLNAYRLLPDHLLYLNTRRW